MLRSATAADIDVRSLYGILRLRSDVFIVEQACAYPDIDGRDIDAATWHVWIPDDTGRAVIAAARVLRDATERHRVGRICTAPPARNRGLASQLVKAALDHIDTTAPGSDVVLDAQTRLVGWYGRLGFVPTGAVFWEDGFHHTEMRLRR